MTEVSRSRISTFGIFFAGDHDHIRKNQVDSLISEFEQLGVNRSIILSLIWKKLGRLFSGQENLDICESFVKENLSFRTCLYHPVRLLTLHMCYLTTNGAQSLLACHQDLSLRRYMRGVLGGPTTNLTANV